MLNSSFQKLYCNKGLRLVLKGAQAFSVNAWVLLLVLKCGTQWYRRIAATPVVLDWASLEVFLLAFADALCAAAALPKSSTWDVALTTSPGGCLMSTAVLYAMGNLARFDSLTPLASCLMLFCQAANFAGCRSWRRKKVILTSISLRTEFFCKHLGNLQNHPANWDLTLKCLDPVLYCGI